MADRSTIERWLQLLIRQTGFDNIVWYQENNLDSYYYAASSGARVNVRSRDDDGLLPYSLEVATAEGFATDSWVAYGANVDHSLLDDSEPEWLSALIRDLYATVKRQVIIDPVQSMLEELEQLPPF